MINIINDNLAKLKKIKIENPELDLRILLKEASLKDKDIVLSNLNVEEIDIEYFNSLVLKRLNFEPISKIINKKFFWKSEFFVNSDVLDPRPESELIIEEVLSNIKKKDRNFKILDIGTGCGCLAISLAKELKNSNITAIDISEKAINVAKKNVNQHNVEKQVNVINLNLENIKKKFDIIVSNPPYIREDEYQNLQVEIKKFEPKVALVGGKDGLKFYRLFSKKIEKIMKKNSLFICEIGYNQTNSCKAIFRDSNLILKNISKDLQKIERTLTFLKI